MFGFSLSSLRKTKNVRKPYQPKAEALEMRDCPAGIMGPRITLTAQVLVGHQVELTGVVTGGNVSGVAVSFNGAVSGTTTTNGSGAFSFTTTTATLGSVSAVGVNQQNQSTNTAFSAVADAAPVVNFTVTHNAGQSVTIAGTLTDLDAAFQTISITGVVAGTVTTDASGNFGLTATATGLGAINAAGTDPWGQSGDLQVMLTSAVPVIENFTAVKGLGTLWQFSGRVVDEYASGLTVRLGGIPSLMNQTTVVGADGWFYFSCFLAEGEQGTATALVTDAWGMESDEVWCLVS